MPAKAVRNKKGEVVLILSLEEAEAIHTVTRKVGGSPSESRRGLVDNVRYALAGLQVSGDVQDTTKNDSVYFTDKPKCGGKYGRS